MSGAKHDDVVQAFPPNGADDAFCVGVLPGRTIGGKYFLNAQCFGLSAKSFAIYGIPVTDKISRLIIHSAGLDKLLCSPVSGWMVGDIEMQDPTTVVAENDEHKKDFETGCWNRKEIERDEFFGVILQECSPAL